MFKQIGQLLFLSFILIFAAIAVLAQKHAERLISGKYNSLTLGINQDGLLTGYYYDARGDDGKGNPMFYCQFFLQGENSNNRTYRVSTWFPETPKEIIMGRLTFDNSIDRKTVNLKLDELPGGCAMVGDTDLTASAGQNLNLDEQGNWSGIRVVSQRKAFFYRSAQDKTRLNSFVVRGDLIRLYQIQNDRAKVKFTSENGKNTVGWMKTSSFFPLRLKTNEK